MEEKYFHVISDNEDGTLTIQQRENTVNQMKWYDTGTSADNSKGPLTVLPALESATVNWTNVNDQTYTMGVTNFKTNAYTGCTSNDVGVTCIVNTYTLPERTAKARMITAQEAGELGCTKLAKSCPNWMNNYSYLATNYGGTQEDNDYGYWTMSAYSSSAKYAMGVNYRGYVESDNGMTPPRYGARAVVVINK